MSASHLSGGRALHFFCGADYSFLSVTVKVGYYCMIVCLKNELEAQWFRMWGLFLRQHVRSVPTQKSFYGYPQDCLTHMTSLATSPFGESNTHQSLPVHVFWLPSLIRSLRWIAYQFVHTELEIGTLVRTKFGSSIVEAFYIRSLNVPDALTTRWVD